MAAYETGRTTDEIHDTLRAAILRGHFPPGQPLRQEELARRYGTSRLPVREALRQLEIEGIVTYKPRCGAVVAEVSVTDALEVMDIRIALECRALRLAIPSMTSIDFTLMREILDAASRSDDFREWDRLNRYFHVSLCAPASKPRLLELINVNFDKLEQFARFHVSRATGNERPDKEHHLILAACERGDIDDAVALLDAHVGYSQRDLAAAERRGRQSDAA